MNTVKNSKSGFENKKRDQAKLHIIDARPKINAIGNKVMGSGYETVDNYESTWPHLCEIENIHKIRESYQRLLELCNNTTKLSSEKWLSYLEGTEWFVHIMYILNGANMIVNSVRMGHAILIHCSDGWDRTSQLSALSQLILEKHYRTIIGFEKLIEKDFVLFGHQFKLRLGHGLRNGLSASESSPVFLQFLDCVHQLLMQFPSLFEFNDEFLCEIAKHINSMRFGTFLMNCEKERSINDLRKKTVSLWTYLNENKEKYTNIFYKPEDPINEIFVPNTSMISMSIWEKVHMKWVYYKESLNIPMFVLILL